MKKQAALIFFFIEAKTTKSTVCQRIFIKIAKMYSERSAFCRSQMSSYFMNWSFQLLTSLLNINEIEILVSLVLF